MQAFHFLASAASHKTGADFAAEGLEGIVGLVVIVAALAALSFVVLSLAKALQAKAVTSDAPVAAPAQSASADIPAHHAKVVAAAALHAALKNGVENPHLPVIFAAVAQAVAEPRTLTLPAANHGWALEGRRGIFASHALKRR